MMAVLCSSLEIDKGCVLITEAGQRFGINDVAVARAMLIYHRYQKVKNGYENYFQLFGLAAFNLSVKISQEKLDTNEVVTYFNEIGIKSASARFNIEDCSNVIRSVEFDILKVVFKYKYKATVSQETLCDPICDIAHRFVFYYTKEFASLNELKSILPCFKTATLKLLNTFYHCQKCTTYTALEMAWAAMYMAFLMYCVDVDEIPILKKELSASVKSDRLYTAVDDLTVVSTAGVEKIQDILDKPSSDY